MPLTDHENKPIPMNGEHPATDYFGTPIDYKNIYYITPNKEIVKPVNVDKYFAEVMKCDVMYGDGIYPKFDMFDTVIRKGDKYYILPDETFVDDVNTDEYFVHVMKAETRRKED